MQWECIRCLKDCLHRTADAGRLPSARDTKEESHEQYEKRRQRCKADLRKLRVGITAPAQLFRSGDFKRCAGGGH